MHAVDKRLALVALASTDVKLTVFANHLRAGKRLQGSYDVAARIASHHHVERIHGLEIVALAETERAGRHHHFVDARGALFHLDMEIGQMGGICGQLIVFEADERGAQRYLTRLGGGEREASE